jgi:hypothetical protein
MHNLLKTITILTDYGHNVFKSRSTLVKGYVAYCTSFVV